MAPQLAIKVGRYANARQFKRIRQAQRTLKGYTGRVTRDLRLHLDSIPRGVRRERVLDTLVLTSRLLHQHNGKLYSSHAQRLISHQLDTNHRRPAGPLQREFR